MGWGWRIRVKEARWREKIGYNWREGTEWLSSSYFFFFYYYFSPAKRREEKNE
jgi:hypothetical protein